MTFMLELKEKLKIFYAHSSAYLIPVLKFVLALAFFTSINSMLGFMQQLNSIFVVLVLALICALIPFNIMIVIGCIMVVGHCYAVSLEVAAFALILFFVLLIFYFRFASREAMGILLSPLAFALNIPCAIPIGFGLMGNPVSAFSAACGVVFYYFMRLVQEKAALIQGMESSELSKKMQILLDGMVQNQTMWLTMITFIAVVIIVYFIRRMSANYAWQIAIVTGSVSYLMIMICGGFFFDVEGSAILVIVQVIVSCLLMFVLKFFVFNVDYSRSEYLQYEDDDYYYYVKAVPKITITQKKHFVKTIGEEPEVRRRGQPKQKTPQQPEQRHPERIVPEPKQRQQSKEWSDRRVPAPEQGQQLKRQVVIPKQRQQPDNTGVTPEWRQQSGQSVVPSEEEPQQEQAVSELQAEQQNSDVVSLEDSLEEKLMKSLRDLQ